MPQGISYRACKMQKMILTQGFHTLDDFKKSEIFYLDMKQIQNSILYTETQPFKSKLINL